MKNLFGRKDREREEELARMNELLDETVSRERDKKAQSVAEIEKERLEREAAAKTLLDIEREKAEKERAGMEQLDADRANVDKEVYEKEELARRLRALEEEEAARLERLRLKELQERERVAKARAALENAIAAKDVKQMAELLKEHYADPKLADLVAQARAIVDQDVEIQRKKGEERRKACQIMEMTGEDWKSLTGLARLKAALKKTQGAVANADFGRRCMMMGCCDLTIFWQVSKRPPSKLRSW